MTDIKKIINHIRHREYMQGIERDQLRVKATAEVFTPTQTVQKMLDKADQSNFTDPTKIIFCLLYTSPSPRDPT